MTRIEEAVKAALQRPAVAPLLPNPDELVSRARRQVRRTRAMSVGTAAIAALTIALASAAIATRSDQRVSTPAHPRPAPSVFVATQTPESDSSVTRLQERAISDGHVVREITSITSAYQAFALAPDGSVIAALSDKGGCTATLERIDRESGQRHVIRQIAQSVSDLSVSPDGRRVAFVTSTECIPSHTAPAAFVQSSAPNGAAPSGFVILDLTTGHLVSTQTDGPGHGLGLATWSPDGRQVATDYFDGHEHVLVMPSDHPDFRTALRVVAPRGCNYSAPTWLRTGLVVAKACGNVDGLPDLKAIVELDRLNAVETKSWSLPTCINGYALTANVVRSDVLVSTFIGHGFPGEDPCADDKVRWHFQVATTDGDRLRTILDQPDKSPVEIGVVGW